MEREARLGHESGRDRAYILGSPFSHSGALTQTADDISGWAREIVQQGRSYLRLQPAYPFIQDGLDMINGQKPTLNIASLSDAQIELTIRNLKELIAAQTNLRIVPAFKTEIGEFRHQCSTMNKNFMSWQQMTFADRRIRKAWQYAAAAGTGYLHTRYDSNFYYKGKGDIALDAYGPMDVLPVGLPRSHDIQRAYCVIHRVETPFHEALRSFPKYADKLRPSRDSSKGRGTVLAQSVKFASAVLKRFGPGQSQENENAPWEMVDIYYIYIDDDSVNNTGRPIPMGTPGTSWYYEVPYLGQHIHVGKDQRGHETFREANHDDCLLYPTRRLIKCTDEDCLTPDPMDQVNPYWHSKVPLTQFRSDDWPWNFLGFPLTRAGQSLEKANNELMRGMIDSCNVRLNPSMAFDRNTMSMALSQSINTRIPGQRVGLDMTFGSDQMKPLVPGDFYTFPAYIPDLVKSNEGRITHQMGVADAVALSRARQLPSSDSADRILDALGPLIKDQSRNMEESIRAMGDMWKSNWFQFITAKRRMELTGPDGLSDEDFDFDPGTLIPSPTFEFADKLALSNIYSDLGRDDLTEAPYFQRARWHKDQFTFSVTPYSIHELNSMTRKLFHLQLMRSGFPLDWWTLAELFDIKNFGPAPKFKDPETGEMRTADTIMERWTVQLEIMARVAQAQGAGQPGAAGHKGHPPTAQNPPALAQKGGGNSIIRESKH